MNATKLYKVFNGIGVCNDHTAKMSGLWSISSSPACNELCKARSKNPEMICANCFAMALEDQYSALGDKLAHNTALLTSKVLPLIELPDFKPKSGFGRIEAFGDLNNVIQAVNYFNIVKRNPAIKFAWWTKNPWIIKQAMQDYNIKKPENLRIIGSSYFKNKDMSDYFRQFDFIDNVFTVYTKDFVQANNIDITCGARSCATCGKCYKGGHKDFNIREQVK